MEPTPATQPFTASITQAAYGEIRRQQRVIDAKVVLAEEEIRNLLAERKELERGLWVEIGRDQLIALLQGGEYGKSIDVRSYSEPYSYDSSATLNATNELLIGGYHNHDHFRYNKPIFVRRDLGRYR